MAKTGAVSQQIMHFLLQGIRVTKFRRAIIQLDAEDLRKIRAITNNLQPGDTVDVVVDVDRITYRWEKLTVEHFIPDYIE